MDFSVFLNFDKAVFQWVEKIFDYGISGVITPILVFLTKLGDSGILWIAIGIALLFFKKTRKVGFTMLGALAVMMVCSIAAVSASAETTLQFGTTVNEQDFFQVAAEKFAELVKVAKEQL